MSKLSPVSYKQLVKVFEADGFRCVRIEGDHMVFTKPGEQASGHSRIFRYFRCSSSKQPGTAGMSRDRYFELLDQ